MTLTAAASFAAGAPAREIYYPYTAGVETMPPNTPLRHIGAYESSYRAPGGTRSGKWTDVSTALPFVNGPWAPMLLTDGTVLIDDYCTSPDQWYNLTPDKKGRYEHGTWSKIAAMPSGYSPLYFAQQVLPDGRVIISGGSYNNCTLVVTNQGALYDPVANSWTSVPPPGDWSTIGAAQSIILPDDTYMLANCCDSPGYQALASISGNAVTWTAQKSYDYNSGQGYTPLPDGNVLMVDLKNSGADYNDYEIYRTSKGSWRLAGQTADLVAECCASPVGPAALTPEGPPGGSIVQIATNTDPGVSDIYSVAKGKWRSGPVLTHNGTTYVSADGGPAATLPDGNILVQACPGYGASPSHFWELKIGSKGKVTATPVSDPNQAGAATCFEGNMLVLPTGQVLWDNSQETPNEVALYTPKGMPDGAWLPAIENVASSLVIGSTGNAISGMNFNGFDLGGVYGSAAQAATNFPLVRITNNGTGDVCFARSYNFSTMGVWTEGTTNADFDIPAGCESGASTLQVIVNGVASAGASVTLKK